MAPTNLVAKLKEVHVVYMCMMLHPAVDRAVTTALYVYGYIMNIICLYNYIYIYIIMLYMLYIILYVILSYCTFCKRPIKFGGSLVKSYFGRTLCPANFFSLFRALDTPN